MLVASPEAEELLLAAEAAELEEAPAEALAEETAELEEVPVEVLAAEMLEPDVAPEEALLLDPDEQPHAQSAITVTRAVAAAKTNGLFKRIISASFMNKTYLEQNQITSSRYAHMFCLAAEAFAPTATAIVMRACSV